MFSSILGSSAPVSVASVEYIAPAPAGTCAAPAPRVLAAQASHVCSASASSDVRTDSINTFPNSSFCGGLLSCSCGAGEHRFPSVKIVFSSWQYRFLVNSNPTSKGSFLVASPVAFYCEQSENRASTQNNSDSFQLDHNPLSTVPSILCFSERVQWHTRQSGSGGVTVHEMAERG